MLWLCKWLLRKWGSLNEGWKDVWITSGTLIMLGLLVWFIRADNWAYWTGFGGETSVSVITTESTPGTESTTENIKVSGSTQSTPGITQSTPGTTITTEATTRDNQGDIVKTVKTETTAPGKKLWDWLSLLGVPLTLVVLGFLFQHKQQERATIAAQEKDKEEALQTYIDRVSKLLLDRNLVALADKVYGDVNSEKPHHNSTLGGGDKELLEATLSVIRFMTLDVLQRFQDDPKRKNKIILFLIEAKVIGKAKLSLRGADLSNADLFGVNLRGADLREANLSGANLSDAILEGVDLEGANLQGSRLIITHFKKAKLLGADFTGAKLCRTQDLPSYVSLDPNRNCYELGIGPGRIIFNNVDSKSPDES